MPLELSSRADKLPIVDCVGSKQVTASDSATTSPLPSTTVSPATTPLNTPPSIRKEANNNPNNIMTPETTRRKMDIVETHKSVDDNTNDDKNNNVNTSPKGSPNNENRKKENIDNNNNDGTVKRLEELTAMNDVPSNSVDQLEEIMEGMTLSNGDKVDINSSSNFNKEEKKGGSFLMSPALAHVQVKSTSKARDTNRFGTIRTKDEKGRLDSFFDMMVKCCRGILTDVKDVKGMLNEGVSEDVLFQAAKGAAQKAVEMNTLVNRAISIYRSDPDGYEFVRDGARDVRTKVIELITSARNCAANRFDFLTQQEFSNHWYVYNNIYYDRLCMYNM